MTLHPFFRLDAAKTLLVLAMGSASAFAQTPPASTLSQEPLIARFGGGARPNVMLTLDTSGSMAFQHMPEGQVNIGNFSLFLPDGINGRGWQQLTIFNEPALSGFSGGNTVVSDPTRDLVPGTGTPAQQAADVYQRHMRSPQVNTIYYNPDQLYTPWRNPAGGFFLPSNPAQAPLDPMAPATVANLTAPMSNLNLSWCTWVTQCATQTLPYRDGLYYILRPNLSPNLASSYTAYNINVAGRHAPLIKAMARTDCLGARCTQAEEQQNFANWFTYYRSRMALTVAGLSDAFGTMDNTMRVGWGEIRSGVLEPMNTDTTFRSLEVQTGTVVRHGVRDFTPAHRTTMLQMLQSRTPRSGTPLREALMGVDTYFARADSAGPWGDVPGNSTGAPASHVSCRRSFNILMTDGYYSPSNIAIGNIDGNVGPVIAADPDGLYPNGQYRPTRPYMDGRSNMLADVAMRSWYRDLRPDLPNTVTPVSSDSAHWQHLNTYTIGLGVTGTLNPATALPGLTSGTIQWPANAIDDLWHTSVNGRGSYFSVSNASQLRSAITGALGNALEREFREGGVVTAAPSLQDGNRKYTPKYWSVSWKGDLTAEVLSGTNGSVVSTVWSAARAMPAYGQRNLFTSDGNQAGVAFTAAGMSAGNMISRLNSANPTELIEWARGSPVNESGASDLFRARQRMTVSGQEPAPLGDMVNSNPVSVGAGQDFGYKDLAEGGSGYGAFLDAKARRPRVIMVGGNDGMVHAFRDTDGQEVYGYVPRATLDKFKLIAQDDYGMQANYHQYFADGPLIEADAYLVPKAPDTGSPSWRSLVLGTFGGGAKGLYVLDVTDTRSLGANTLRWEKSSDGDLGHQMVTPALGKLPGSGNDRWKIFVGSGFASTNGRAVLLVIDAATGNIDGRLVADAGPANGLGGVDLVYNDKREVIGAYAGDLKGNLWRFDFIDASGAAPSSAWKVGFGGVPLYKALSVDGQPQAISAAPVHMTHDRGGQMVVFGTGRLADANDVNITQRQTVYGIWDKVRSSEPSSGLSNVVASRQELVAQTIGSAEGPNGTYFSVSANTVDYATLRGWHLDLTVESGSRVIYPLQMVGKTRFMLTAMAPAVSPPPCQLTAGNAYTMILPMQSGGREVRPILDTDGDGLVGNGDLYVSMFKHKPEGMRRVIASPNTTNRTGGEGGTGFGTTDPNGGTGPGGSPDPNKLECTSFASIGASAGSQVGLICDNPPPGARTVQDRVWRRIITPPRP